MKSYMDLKGKIALVTGGGSGIGRAISEELAKAGAKVIIASRRHDLVNTTATEINNIGGDVIGVQLDVGNPKQIEDVVKRINKEIGKIDILINNAGTGIGGKPIWEEDYEDWWKVMEVNVRGPLILSSLVMKEMVVHGSGSIINIGSFIGIRPSPMVSAYGISKTTLIRFTDTLAQEIDNPNIGVFCISPGLVLTDMTKDIPQYKDLPPEVWTPVEKTPPMVMKLVSGRYNDLSGRMIHVTWDLDEMLANSEKIQKEGLYQLKLANLDGFEE